MQPKQKSGQVEQLIQLNPTNALNTTNMYGYTECILTVTLKHLCSILAGVGWGGERLRFLAVTWSPCAIGSFLESCNRINLSVTCTLWLQIPGESSLPIWI